MLSPHRKGDHAVIRTIVAPLFLSLMPLMAMESKAPEVEMYSDEMPKSKFVFSLDLSTEEKSKSDSAYSFLIQKFDKNKNITNLNLYSNRMTDRNNGRTESILELKNGDESIFLVLQYQDSEEYQQPSFKNITYYVDDSVYVPEKWDVPRPLKLYTSKKDRVNEMSWKFIDFAVHSQIWNGYENNYIEVTPLEEKLFKAIKSRGLTSSLTRGVVVQSILFKYDFYSIYNNENELKLSSGSLEYLNSII